MNLSFSAVQYSTIHNRFQQQQEDLAAAAVVVFDRLEYAKSINGRQRNISETLDLPISYIFRFNPTIFIINLPQLFIHTNMKTLYVRVGP